MPSPSSASTIYHIFHFLIESKEKDALKALREKYGKNCSVTVGSIEVQEDTYEISVEDFLKHAKKVSKGSEGSEEGSESDSEGYEVAKN